MKTIGYKIVCYFEMEYQEEIASTYNELRTWFINEFGWDVWFNTKERNCILTDEIYVHVEINHKMGSMISYGNWMKKKKELPRKEFHKWVVAYINQEDATRKLAEY